MSTTTTKKTSPIRALTGFSTLNDANLVVQADAVIAGMTNNAAYPNPPIAIATFSTGVTTYSNAIAAALDGGKNAKAVREKQKKLVVADLRQLAMYVESNCNDDMPTFTSSGFVAKSKPSPSAPVTAPVIKSVDYGTNSGQILVSIKSVSGAKSYNLRYASIGQGGTPGTWTIVNIGSIKKAITVGSLTPGTTYAFQAQALGAASLSDWSDSTTIMCV